MRFLQSQECKSLAHNEMGYLCLLVVCVVCLSQSPEARAYRAHADSVPVVKVRDAMILNARFGPEMALSSSVFFRHLNEFAGVAASDLSAPVSYNASIRLRYNTWSYGFDVGRFTAIAASSGVAPVYSNSMPPVLIGNRTSSQLLNVSATPVAFNVVYSPSATQFREYLSFGAGIAFTKTKWTENITSDFLGDDIASGVRLNTSKGIPLARVGAGVELCFDHYSNKTSGSILVELAYTFAPNALRPFASLPPNDTRFAGVRDASVDFGMSSLRLLVGVQLSSVRTHE